MLKKSICLVVVGIFAVFGAIGILVLADNNNVQASGLGGDGKMKVYFVEDANSTDMKSYTIRLFKNEANGVLETRANDVKIPQPSKFGFKKDGYSFKGWRKSNEVITYTEYLPHGLSENDGVIIFVAEWNALSYNLSFVPAHPTTTIAVAPSPMQVTSGVAMAGLADRTNGTYNFTTGPDGLVVNGYKFMGWRTAANGQGIAMLPTNAFNLAKHTIVYGHWIENSVAKEELSATFSSRIYGTNEQGPKQTRSYSYYAGATITYTFENLVMTGYTFLHLYIDANLTVYPTDFIDGQYSILMVTTDLAMVAYYSIIDGGDGDGNGDGNGGVPARTYIGTSSINGQTTTFTFKTGSTFTFHADRFDIYEGKKFTGVTITTTAGSSTVNVNQFDENGNYTTGAYASNVVFIANFQENVKVKLTIKYMDVNGKELQKADVTTGPYNEQIVLGLKDWKDADGEVFFGYDTYEGYNFSHFHLNGVDYDKNKLMVKGSNWYFIFTIKADSTVIVYYNK